MGISEVINLILCILSFLLAVVSVVTVIVTLKQNSIMIENESRAYLSIYVDSINSEGSIFYLIIKNFGRSNALITSLKCNTDLSKFSYIETLTPFAHMENASIAPNQSYKCALMQIPLFASGITSIDFEICYQCNNKKYSDTFCINLKFYLNLIHSTASVTNGNELKIIAKTLQDLDTKLL